MLGNIVEGWHLKYVRNAYLLFKGPECCVSWNLEGYLRYRDDGCAICAGQASIYNSVSMRSELTH